jgi:plastocyanin
MLAAMPKRSRMLTVGLALLGLAAFPLPGAGQVPVTGRLTILEKHNKPSSDLGQAVLWLEGPHAPEGRPDTVLIATEDKQFVPRVVVVPLGSTVTFPNHDPFNHNVFSLSKAKSFDLGLYSRGQGRSVTFDQPGVIRVYCNVHAQMRAFVLVRQTGLVTQPGSDGTFRFEQVPPGEYVLHAWHERAKEIQQAVVVASGSPPELSLTLDARGYHYVQHLDKEGQSYSDRDSRY